MHIEWIISDEDKNKITLFIEKQKDNFFVKDRINRNIKSKTKDISKEKIWYVIVGCLLTTQQRSGPNSRISQFLSQNPFPLSYNNCINIDYLSEYVYESLSTFGGIRRTNIISKELKYNLLLLEDSFWKKLQEELRILSNSEDMNLEKKIANIIAKELKGFGPKQSRNFLQWLGLSRYEIPIDSRITGWLNNFGFPLKLSAGALGDKNYYQFVSDGIKYLCSECNIYPCVLDAAIFSSYDKDEWSAKNIAY